MSNDVSAVEHHIVSTADTARAVGSGDVDVLGTPRLIAWLEAATVAALDLPETDTSVGTRVDVQHLLASPVGAAVAATARLVHRDGRLCRFAVAAHHDVGEGPVLIAEGEVTRVVVDRTRFIARSTPEVLIRRATPEEWEAISRLRVDAYSTGHGLTDETDSYVHALREVAPHAAEGEVLVAYADAALVGTVAVFAAGSTYADIALPGELEFRFMAVAPARWRQGLGAALLGAVVAGAGDSPLVCSVIDGNDPAATLYERLGFRREPARDRPVAPEVLLRAYRRAAP